jgi:hypothetical protein
MMQSHVISIDGAFVGAAVRLDRGYRFVATDIRMDELNGTWWPTLEEVQHRAHRLYRAGDVAAQSHASADGAAPAARDG